MAKTLVLNGTNFSTNKLDTVVFSEMIPCTGITLNESTKSLTSMTAFTLTATVTPVDTTDQVSWASSDPTVASVANGVVTPLKLGTTTITATCGNQSATCAVTIDNVVPDYIAISGYSPFRRSSQLPSLTLDKYTGATSGSFMIAANKATGLYPIESKDNVDTSPYRFVPVMIPNGATKMIISTSLGNGKIKTRMEYTDSTRSASNSTYPNDSAYCLQGSTGAFDQGSTTATPLTIDLPTNLAGLDSLCLGFLIGSSSGTYTTDTGTDVTEYVSIAFTYDAET